MIRLIHHCSQSIICSNNLKILTCKVIFSSSSGSHFNWRSYSWRNNNQIFNDHIFRSSSRVIKSKWVWIFIWDSSKDFQSSFREDLILSVINRVFITLLDWSLSDLQWLFLNLKVSMTASIYISSIIFVRSSTLFDVFRDLVDSIQSFDRVLDSLASLEFLFFLIRRSFQLQFATIVANTRKYLCTYVNVATMPDWFDEFDKANMSWTVLLIWKRC